MANTKISALTSATTPLAGTETLPIVQSSATTKVTVANLTAGRAVLGASFKSNTWVQGQAPRQNPNTSGTAVDYALVSGDNIGSIALYTGQSNVPAINTSWMQVRNQADFSLTYNLAIQPSGGQVVIGTMTSPTATTQLGVAVGNIQMMTAAKGINFTANTPAAGMTSQLLNWYEEGTWTPNQGAGLTVVGAFSSTGRYTRIGRQVSISGTVTGATSVAVTAAGVITSNLPFTVVTAGHGDATNVAINASATVICTGTSVTSAAAIAATATITFSATYFV